MHRHQVGSDGPERLGRISLFSELSVGRRRMLADLLDELVADAGEVLMAEGDAGYELMMLEDGSAEVSQSGRTINKIEPGDFFGEMAVLDGGAQRTATVTALTPVRVLLFTAHSMREIERTMPDVEQRLLTARQQHRDDDAAR